MALALSSKQYSDAMIMTLGRWRSLAFLDYIRSQVVELTTNMAQDMVSHEITDLSGETKTEQVDDGIGGHELEF